MNRISILIVILVILLFTSGVGSCWAQTQSMEQDETEARLKIHVHLALGVTTVAKATAALSKQTGLTITAAGYLRSRKLMMQLNDLSARAALDALAELNDWTWYETQPNHIVLVRRSLRLPPEPNNMALLIQAAMPADLRTYLNIARPVEDIRQIEWDQRKGFPSVARATVAYGTAVNHLIATLNADALQQEPRPYSKLSSAQQDDLLTLLFYGALKGLGTLICSDQPLYELNPSDAEIRLLDNYSVMITTKTVEKGRVGYGIMLGMNPHLYSDLQDH